jgi:hypothetical protein
VKESKSEFLKWFEAQFGKRPVSEKDEIELQKEFYVSQATVLKLERRLRELRSWDCDQRAALYAWNARETWIKCP